ncbi:NADPH-dependent F420 reductase [Leifsonia sp. LS1]|uniref:NADPH-dependent F420 reductase n=1 Tax=Leifsonia sp. LS1 TaxID=2828483 RepID=UPI001CFEF9B1|nr:NAD(P)-binding domain-containing protein [Leifsonia sp. LS1]GIT80020.1 NADPH-dependent F420 reductase [Leifsonia sp. LS1]
MRIGILGTGAMTAALGRRLSAIGHDVVVGSRDPLRAEALAREVGASSGTDLLHAAQSDVVIVAVRDTAALEVVRALAGELAGRVVLDLGNPIDPPHFESRYGAGPSLAERMAEAAPGAIVVKAFNTVYAEQLAGDGSPQVLVAADDGPAKTLVTELVVAIGCEPLDVGALRVSRHLERLAGFEVDLVEGGYARATSLRVIDLPG